MRMIIVQNAAVQMDRTLDCFRIPVRDILSRTDDFEEKFDFLTLFYDVFWSVDGAEVMCVGPPFRFGAIGETLRFLALPSGTACEHRHERGEAAAENSRSLFRLRPPAGTTALEIILGRQRSIIAIQPNLSAVFAGQNVLLVLSQDNRLPWIIDWINYHARLFNFRAVLFLDNRSTAYAPDQLAQAIRDHCDIDRCVVMAADFPYGPLGNPGLGARTDSNFLQVGLYESARHRFLRTARMVANFDIDELLVQRGEGDFMSLLCSKRRPVTLIPRVNTLGPVPAGEAPRHAMFDRVFSRSDLLPKWIIQPRILDETAQLHIHSVGPAKKRRIAADGPFFIAHLLQITNGWNDAGRLRIDDAALAETRQDADLRAHLDRAFSADQLRPPHLWSAHDSADPNYLCQCAARALRANDAAAALRFATRATELDAEHFQGIVFQAKALLALGQVAEAAEARARLVRRRYRDPRFYAVMARYHARDGRFDAALHWCEQGLAFAPEHTVLLVLRAEYTTPAATAK